MGKLSDATEAAVDSSSGDVIFNKSGFVGNIGFGIF